MEMERACLGKREKETMTRTALLWTIEGKRTRGKAKTTWSRDVQREMKAWKEMAEHTKESHRQTDKWKILNAAPHVSRRKG